MTNEVYFRERARQLVGGQISLAEYVGLSKTQLFSLARQAYQFLITGNVEKAREIYRGLVAVDPAEGVFHCHLGAAELRLGNSEAAYEQFNLALRQNPTDSDALVGRGEIYLRRGQLAEAAVNFRLAVKIDKSEIHVSTARAKAVLLKIKNSLEKKHSN